MGLRHPKFRDHSGLNDESRLSAGDMVRALLRAGTDGALHDLMKEVPALDDKGNALVHAGYEIRAKTGSLNFVSSLAGYIAPERGAPLVFAIFSGDMARRAGLSADELERPAGARGWASRARLLQQRLIHRWAVAYGG